MTLDEILTPIALHRNQFELHLDSILDSNVPIVKDVLNYMNLHKGKRLRPNVMFLVSQALGGTTQHTYDNAAMVELLHNASLVHDDVVDEASERRGSLSINAKWNNKVSVLIGDYLFAHSMRTAFENKDYDFIHTMFSTIEVMTEGELLSIQQSNTLEYNEDSYYKIIFAKTASLISSCCKSGAKIVTNNEKYIDAFIEYGRYVGMAFQIKDDIFDYISNSNTIGKPVGNDIKERKITLPLIYSLDNTDTSTSNKIIALIKNNNITDEDIKTIITFAIDGGGIEYSMNKAIEFADKAISYINFLDDSEAKKSLIAFAKYVVEREK